ncbi:MAG: RHS repeat-associated core domain-containing protein, partial [Acidobacteriota bacterium]
EYDGENRQTKFNSTVGQYFYDGDGRRVKKIDGSGTTVFVYNVGGQLIAEYHNDPVPAPPGGGGTSYLTSDHLGSTRVVTKSDGSVKARYDYLPFGEELGATIGGRTVGTGYGAADGTKQKFTQKERDSESGLDYFLARYYSSAQGRFTSVDPLMASASVTAPQSWNRYAYAFNNPLRFIDPDGQEVKVLDEKALEYIRSTLPKAVRDRVKLDKNGMIDRKALNGIKSKDKNVLDLKALANSSSVIEAATGKGVSGQPEFSYTSVEQVRKEVIDALVKRGEDPKDAAEVAKEVSLPTEFLGRTQTANESGSGNPRVVVSDGTGAAATAPMQELVVTMAHELYGHGLPLTKGKPWGHDNGGPVDVNIRRIEQQTKRNFPGPQATPQSPRPKKP